MWYGEKLCFCLVLGCNVHSLSLPRNLLPIIALPTPPPPILTGARRWEGILPRLPPSAALVPGLRLPFNLMVTLVVAPVNNATGPHIATARALVVTCPTFVRLVLRLETVIPFDKFRVSNVRTVLFVAVLPEVIIVLTPPPPVASVPLTTPNVPLGN